MSSGMDHFSREPLLLQLLSSPGLALAGLLLLLVLCLRRRRTR